MHRKSIILVSACAAAIALGGCTSTGGINTAQIAAIQNAAKAACGYLPTVETVANILASNNAILAPAASIAQTICNAVTALGARRGGAQPTAYGIVIHGQFVGR